MITKVKIYNDGSHYIALPIVRSEVDPESIFAKYKEKDLSGLSFCNVEDLPFDVKVDDNLKTAKEIFEENYTYLMSLSKKERFDYFHSLLDSYFSTYDFCTKFIQASLNRKYRNFVYRKLRCLRKLNLTDFNYFSTITYDSNKLTEEDFRAKFSKFLQNKSDRSNWSYIGVWERGSSSERLHFHALMNVPEGSLPGKNEKKRKWSSKVKRLVTVTENSYLLNRFGANDFSAIDLTDAEEYYDLLNYLLKYIEKSGERLVYSRGLNQFMEANVDDENDVLAVNYMPCVKYTLYDDFNVFDDNHQFIGKADETVLGNLKKRMN